MRRIIVLCFIFTAVLHVSAMAADSMPPFGGVGEIVTQPPSAPQPVQPSASRASADSMPKAGELAFNFDDADIYEVIRAFTDILNINYVVDPNVRGKVTVHTTGSLKKEDMFSIFFQILEANGLTAVKDGNIYNIVSIKDASRLPAAPHVGSISDRSSSGERMVIQIIPLNYISSEEMAKLLAPFVSGGGAVVSHKQPNTLVVADKDSNIRKILRLIQAFDVNFFEKSGYRFYLLEHSDAEEMAKLCTDVFGIGDANKDQVKFIAISRLNTVLAVSANPGIFSRVEEVIRQADIAGDKAQPRIHVYSVKNGEAEELAELLNSVFSETPSEKKESDKTIKETEKKEVKKDDSAIKSLFPGSNTTLSSSKKTGTTKKSEKKSGTAGTIILRNGMRITPDTVRNALIIEAAPKDYRMIADILEKIDVLPRQVLIRVVVAEITLNVENKLGVEWSYVRGNGGTPDTSVLKGAIGSPGVTDFAAFSGLKFMIGEDNRWGATLSALASDGKVNILSTPSVLASDNKEANIEISDEIPIPDTQYQYQNTLNPSLQTSIQYRNTGVILTVTPHINEFGLVSMDVKQEVSEVKDQTIRVGNLDASAFFKRSLETSLTVKDGQTIVLGGLIKEKKSNTVTGVPCLTSIPVVQYLFGTKSHKDDKTELIVLITPQVISSLDDVDAVTREFKSKVDRITHEAE